MNLTRLAISVGDPNGIGIEVVLKAITRARPGLDLLFEPVLFGPAHVIQKQALDLGIELACEVVDVSEPKHKKPFQFASGTIDARAGELAMRSVKMAAESCLGAQTDALVTAPISKEAIRLAGYSNPGHTEYLASITGAGCTIMMMVHGAFRVGLVTTHIPIAEVASHISIEGILSKMRTLDESLRIDFHISAPRIAVLGLNPHAGEAGTMGREEIEIIAPAMEAARAEGISTDGPFPADGFFGMRRQEECDAVLAIYHDQGLIPFKTMAFDTGVNFTAGLPIVRTSPDHGTAFDIAGTDKASSTSMERALALAIEVAGNRAVPRS